MAEPTSRRKLAAILCADAVGYARLMQGDEAATVATLKDYRAAIGRVIERHQGRIVNAPGDSILAEFASAVEAVQAAVEIQHSVRGRNVELAEDRRMEFRVGINLGDVIEEDDGTIYGDGVNIAARMEALADAGGVCVSSTVYDAVAGKLALGFDFLGAQQVKNIANPVNVYRVRSETRPSPATPTKSRTLRWAVVAAAAVVVIAIGLAGAWLWGERAGAPADGVGGAQDPVLALPAGPSIAVLPFVNLSGDPEQDYFVDGITEEIITALTQFRELFVIARNSTFQYKGQALDVRRIGEELGVRYVLEGSVRRAADTIRVTAQLIDAQTGAHLWAETYDRALSAETIFAVQDEITEHVVARIAEPFGVISRAGVKAASGKATDSLDAYECVLRTREFYGIEVPDLFPPIRDCLERAVAREPDYADAWAWLALMYLNEHRFDFSPRIDPPPLDRALVAAQRAVGLAPDSEMPHFALASVYYFRKDLNQFRLEANNAIAINPSNALVIAELAGYFGYLGEFDRSLALTRKAMALNPHHPTWYYATVFNYHYHKREYEAALAAVLNWNEPYFFGYQVHLAQAYAMLGRQAEAEAAIAELLQLRPDFSLEVARRQLEMWNRTEPLIVHELNGLRRAGLRATAPAN